MRKWKVLSDFDQGQNVMAKCPCQSIFKMAGIVGCAWYALASTFQKWSTEGQSANGRQGHEHGRFTDACEDSGIHVDGTLTHTTYHTSQLTWFKACTADILVPDTSGHLQRFSKVPASTHWCRDLEFFLRLKLILHSVRNVLLILRLICVFPV